MAQLFVGFVIGFVVATVGLNSVFKFTDTILQKSQVILKENVK